MLPPPGALALVEFQRLQAIGQQPGTLRVFLCTIQTSWCVSSPGGKYYYHHHHHHHYHHHYLHHHHFTIVIVIAVTIFIILLSIMIIIIIIIIPDSTAVDVYEFVVDGKAENSELRLQIGRGRKLVKPLERAKQQLTQDDDISGEDSMEEIEATDDGSAISVDTDVDTEPSDTDQQSHKTEQVQETCDLKEVAANWPLIAANSPPIRRK